MFQKFDLNKFKLVEKFLARNLKSVYSYLVAAIPLAYL